MKIHSAIFEGLYDMYAGRHEPENLRRFADLYWRTVLGVAFLLSVGGFAYGILTLDGIISDLDAFSNDTVAPAPALDRSGLGKVVAAFEARRAHTEALRGGASVRISDPSK